MSVIWPCSIPADGCQGLSPTWQICPCECNDCTEAKSCDKCESKCGQIDFQLTWCGTLSTENQVTSSIIYALAMRKRLRDDDFENQGKCEDRGGWFGNQLISQDWNPGTYNWTRRHQVMDGQETASVISDIEQEIVEATEYLVDEGLIQEPNVDAEIDNCGRICVQTLQIKPTQNGPEREQWAWMWETQSCGC